jgi:hypothetical protein
MHPILSPVLPTTHTPPFKAGKDLATGTASRASERNDVAVTTAPRSHP